MNNGILKMALALMAGLTFAACTQDEVEDNNKLPEGKYPLQIGSVSIAGAEDSQTRLTESTDGMSSSFVSGNAITVMNSSSNKTGTYTYSGSAFSSSSPVYWESTATSTVNAWYPAAAYNSSSTVSLSDQSSGLAYVLKGTGSGSYKNSVSLSFTHQLAKVRIQVKKGTYTGNMNVTSVKVKGYTSCTAKNGAVSNPQTEGYITTKLNNGYYEANLYPNTLSKSEAIELVVDGTTKKVDLSSDLTLTAGSYQTITVTLNEESYTEVNVSSILGSTYTVSGNIHLVGNGNAKDLFITVNTGSKLILDNVNINNTDQVAAIVCQGDATIKLKGSNIVTSKYDGIVATAGTMAIEESEQNSSLTVTACKVTNTNDCYGNHYIVTMGATNNANITINSGKIAADASATYHVSHRRILL